MLAVMAGLPALDAAARAIAAPAGVEMPTLILPADEGATAP